FPSRDTNSRYSHLFKKVRRYKRSRRVGGKLRPELMAIESLRELLGGFPHSVVNQHTASTNPTVELGGYKAGLQFTQFRMRGPGFHHLFDVFVRKIEFVNENHWTLLCFQLCSERDGFVHFDQFPCFFPSPARVPPTLSLS